MRIDATKLPTLNHIIEPAEVISIPAGATPKPVIVELPGTDGPRVRVYWTGSPSLTVGDFVAIQRRNMGALQYVIIGTSGVTPSSAPGWTFTHVLTVSATDPDADYTTIPLAIAGAADGDAILVDAETISISATITVDKALMITSLGGTVITSSVAGPTFELTDAAGATLENLIIRNTGAGAKSGCVKWAVDDVTLSNCVIEKLSGASTVGYGLWQAGGFNAKIIDTFGECTDPPGTNYGYLNDTANCGVLFIRGQMSGLTADIFTARASSNISGQFVEASTVSWAGTSAGWYFKAGNLVPFVGTGIMLGCWLEDISTGFRIYYDTLTAAIAAAAAGDIIWLEAGTYTGPFTLNKDVTLKGAGQRDTILTQGTAGASLIVSTAGAAVEDLTVLSTFATGTVKAIDITASCRMRNVIATASGAATTGYGIAISGATVDLIGCEVSSTGATTKIGLDVAASSVVNLYGGVYGGATYDMVIDTSTITLVDPVLTNSIILSATATVKGSYRNAAGDIVLVGSSILAGVDKYIISATVAASDLTVALKTLAGADPSEGSPVFVKIGDVVRPVTAALSVTANDGTNWFSSGSATTATLDVDYFVYLIQETGASAGTKIGFARIPYARTMADFVNTTTSQFYIKGNWTNFNATDAVTNIGRFNAILSATAAFTWSLTTAVIVNRPIYETRRLAFTSAITSQTGTITTVGTVTSSYIIAGRYFYIWQSIAITTNGTGATAVLSTIPLTPGGILTVMPGREVLVSGKMLQGYVQATTTATWVNYDNSYPGASGANLACGGVAIPLV